ncbi:MAG: DEAD/DEAH box helicase [Acidimicrobiales bacterium]
MATGAAGPPRSFDIDRFQVEAIDHVEAGRSVVVSAPTGSGKTFVAEHALWLARGRGRRGLYTTPIKALSNQKFRDLRGWMGTDDVGLLTGDNSINGDAAAVVMTTEVLRNMLYAEPERLATTDIVVMDEVHYLQDNYRGPVWEEVIIHLPSHIRLVALSATVSNADELAEWISEVHAPCAAVTETRRPVELENLYHVGEKNKPRRHLMPVLKKGRANPEGRRFDPGRSGDRSSRGGKRGRGRGSDQQRGERRPWRTPRRHEVIKELERRDLLPAITFIFSRAGCEDAVSALRNAGVRLTDDAEAARISTFVEERTRHLSEVDRTALGFDPWRRGLHMGLAAHHAGIVPLFKETVEELFAAGLLKAVFATETLALGVNMPARTVVIEKLSKFTGEHHEALTPGDYTQLTGRAGRRGIDEKGHAVVLWTPFTTFDEVATLARSGAFELRSAFRPTYNMSCHLVSRYTRREAEELLTRSFGQFQSNRAIEDLEQRRARLLSALDQVDDAAPERSDVVDIDAITRVLSGLRPGDAVDVGSADTGQVVAVLSVAMRRKEVQVRVIDRDGATHIVDPDALGGIPVVVATFDLPSPFDPNNTSHQHELVGRLRQTRRRASARARQRSGNAASGSSGHVAQFATPSPWKGSDQAQQRRELRRVEARIKERRGRLIDRFGAIVALLSTLGHIDNWNLTERGRILLGTFHELDLVIVESLLEGHLDGHDPATLAGVVATFVHEPRRHDDGPEPWFSSDRAESAIQGIFDVHARVVRLESAHGLPESREIDPGLFAAVHAWAAGAALGDILDEEDLTGGDFVRSVKQVVDVLSQIATVAPDRDTRSAAQTAVSRIRRGIVDAPFDPEQDGDVVLGGA